MQRSFVCLFWLNLKWWFHGLYKRQTYQELTYFAAPLLFETVDFIHDLDCFDKGRRETVQLNSVKNTLVQSKEKEIQICLSYKLNLLSYWYVWFKLFISLNKNRHDIWLIMVIKVFIKEHLHKKLIQKFLLHPTQSPTSENIEGIDFWYWICFTTNILPYPISKFKSIYCKPDTP